MRKRLAGLLIRTAHRIYRPTVTEVRDPAAAAYAEIQRRFQQIRDEGNS